MCDKAAPSSLRMQNTIVLTNTIKAKCTSYFKTYVKDVSQPQWEAT